MPNRYYRLANFDPTLKKPNKHDWLIISTIQFMNEIISYGSLWCLRKKNVCKAHLSSWQIISLQCYWNSSFRTYSFFCAVLSFLGNKDLYQVVEKWKFFFLIYNGLLMFSLFWPPKVHFKAKFNIILHFYVKTFLIMVITFLVGTIQICRNNNFVPLLPMKT